MADGENDEDEDAPTVTLGQYLSQSVIRNWLFLVALAAHVAIWFRAPAIWVDQVWYGLDSRGGLGFHHHSPGWNDVALVVMCAIIYPVLGIGMQWRWFRLLPPDRAPFLRWLGRIAVLALLFATYAMLRARFQ